MCWRLGDIQHWCAVSQHILQSAAAEPEVRTAPDIKLAEAPRNVFIHCVTKGASDAKTPLQVDTLDWKDFARSLARVQPSGALDRATYLSLRARFDAPSNPELSRAEDGAAWLPIELVPQVNDRGDLPLSDNVRAVSALVLDIYNRGTAMLTPKQLMASLPPAWSVAWHTTFGHQRRRPQFRVVIPWAKPISPHQQQKAFEIAQRWFGHRLDPYSADPAAHFFLPSCPVDAVFDFRAGMQGDRFATFDEAMRMWTR
jgi:hypothetical protein